MRGKPFAVVYVGNSVTLTAIFRQFNFCRTVEYDFFDRLVFLRSIYIALFLEIIRIIFLINNVTISSKFKKFDIKINVNNLGCVQSAG